MTSLVRLGGAVLLICACNCGAGGNDEYDFGDVDIPPVEECAGYDCLACASGTECAAADNYIDGTCCAAGDSLVHTATGVAAEAVDVEANDTYAIACGGFGARVNDVSNPRSPSYVGVAGDRCQHAAFGIDRGDGQVFYLTHHGDSWRQTPSVAAYVVDGNQAPRLLQELSEPGVLYEGMAWKDDYLYIAAHAGGLRVYETDASGELTHVATLGEFGNAWRVDVEGDYAYVADNEVGVRVVSIANPAAPLLVDTFATTGAPRDIEVHDGRIYVALGGSGVDVFDVSNPAALVAVANIPTLGSAQSVAVQRGILSVAAWSHVAIYSTDKLQLLGTERTRSYPDFEQDLGVAQVGEWIFVAEWEGLHVLEARPGYVAPDVWIEEEFYQFAADERDAQAILVRNIGRLGLVIRDIRVTDDAFSADRTSLEIGAGGVDVIEVEYQPPGPGSGTSFLEMTTNDPDDAQASYRVPLITSDTNRIDVGDQLTEQFAFLDPNGAGQLSGLEGKVIVLAYFALF